jgi:hypothetical protein
MTGEEKRKEGKPVPLVFIENKGLERYILKMPKGLGETL